MECPRPVSPQERGVDMAANDDMDQQPCPLSRRNIDSVRFRQHQAYWRSGLRPQASHHRTVSLQTTAVTLGIRVPDPATLS
jgi:hypothetical protein